MRAARREREKSEKKTFEGKLETMGTMTDPDTALAAIKAAGDDFQSLYEAIKKADFLDKTPGDYRQQLRGKRAREKERERERGRRSRNTQRIMCACACVSLSPPQPSMKLLTTHSTLSSLFVC